MNDTRSPDVRLRQGTVADAGAGYGHGYEHGYGGDPPWN
ncbi:hypothetical protein Halxa_3684 [Halopiger xanaduensis SH-6]|uniref:Uncharacterized protein n=1 Tax=Halopiger xanaduensis (strain DSM 18323 / JCM 14033 / SH-6) TaxID=797210 RepID=F8DBM5_HALXS|nr:hypothetical protein Halxa_3684 [Halopiger xanaduensis SH-6]